MKKMTKLMALLLILVMSVSLFAGCKKEKKVDNPVTPVQEEKKEDPKVEDPVVVETPALEPESGATLLVWESEGKESQFIEEAAKAFEAKYGVTVTYEPVGHTDSADKIALDGPNGVGADVFVAPHDHLGKIAVAGLALENDSFGDTYTSANFSEKAISAVTFDGKVYGYPIAVETYFLIYNKDLVQTVPETYEEIIEFSKTFNDARNNKFALMWDVGNAYFTYNFLGGYADLFGPNGDDKATLGIDTPEAVEALKFFQSLRATYDVQASDANYDAMMTSFKAGNAAFIINGPWAIQDLIDAGLNFGVAPLPKLPNGTPAKGFSGTRGAYVSSYTKYPNAAKLFADFVANEMAAKRYEMTSQIPATNKVELTNDVDKAIFAQYNNAFPMPKIPEMAAYWTTMAGTYANIWNGNDVQAEVNAAVAAIKENIN